MKKVLLILAAITGLYSLSFLTKTPEKISVTSHDSINHTQYKDLQVQVRNLKLYSKLNINDLESAVNNLVTEKTTYIHPKVETVYLNSYQWIYLAAMLMGASLVYSFSRRKKHSVVKETQLAKETSDESQIIYLCDSNLQIMWQSYGANELNLDAEQFEEMIGHSYLLRPYELKGNNYLVKFHQVNDGSEKGSYLFNLIPFTSYKEVEASTSQRTREEAQSV